MKNIAGGLLVKPINKICDKHHVHYVSYQDEKIFCPECEKETVGINSELRRMQDKLRVKRYRGYLRTRSLVDRKEMFDCTFDNFKFKQGSKEQQVLQASRKIAGEYFKKPYKNFNTLMYGSAGAGKSHLAMAILNAVNDNSDPMVRVLFLSIPKLASRMRDYRADPINSIWSQEYVDELIKPTNLIVIDDLGAESAGGDGATRFVQNVIFNILDDSQRVIVTTNLSMSELKHTYHQRLISRIQEGSLGHTIDFSNIQDKRMYLED